MATKTTATGSKEPAHSRVEGVPTREAIEAAYRIHTLAQILYARIAALHPWAMPALPPWAGYCGPTSGQGPGIWPFSGSDASGASPFGGATFPMMGMPAAGIGAWGAVPDAWGPCCVGAGGWPVASGSGPCVQEG
jgi:hypothetical protein